VNVLEGHQSLIETEFVIPTQSEEKQMETEIKDRRKMLKVKLKSLAAESRIIRLEELRSRGSLRDELCVHRRTIVRSESRHTGLAYGFIRGRSYSQLEPTAKRDPDWKRVEKMIKQYGPVAQPKEGYLKQLEHWGKVHR